MHRYTSAIEGWPISQAIAAGSWYFPSIEVVHVMAISVVVGSIFLLDLRLLNFHTRHLRVTQLSRDVLPWTWGAFTVALITGTLMFVSSAGKYGDNIFFRVKLLLLLLAGVNMLIFHVGIFRRVSIWDDAPTPPFAARAAGGLSLMFWVGVVICGRWIGFT